MWNVTTHQFHFVFRRLGSFGQQLCGVNDWTEFLTHWVIYEVMWISNAKMLVFRAYIFPVHTWCKANLRIKFVKRLRFGAHAEGEVVKWWCPGKGWIKKRKRIEIFRYSQYCSWEVMGEFNTMIQELKCYPVKISPVLWNFRRHFEGLHVCRGREQITGSRLIRSSTKRHVWGEALM